MKIIDRILEDMSETNLPDKIKLTKTYFECSCWEILNSKGKMKYSIICNSNHIVIDGDDKLLNKDEEELVTLQAEVLKYKIRIAKKKAQMEEKEKTIEKVLS